MINKLHKTDKMNGIPNRKQRREAMKYQGALRMISSAPYKKKAEIRQGQLARGRDMHAANVDYVDRERFARLEVKEAAMMKTWQDLGYNDAEVEMLREAWGIDAVGKATREDVRKKSALIEKARKSFNNRS